MRRAGLITEILLINSFLYSQPPLVETDTLRIPDSIIVQSGDTVTIEIHLINTLAVVGFGLNIALDSMIVVDDVYPGESIDSFWNPYTFSNDDTIQDTFRYIYIFSYTWGNPYTQYFPPGDHIIAYMDLIANWTAIIPSGGLLPLVFYDDSLHNPPRYNIITDTIDFVDKLPIKDNGSIFIPTNVEEFSKEHFNKIEILTNMVRSSIPIRLNVDKNSWVELSVFDVRGRRVLTLLKGEISPGVYTVKKALPLPSGLYFLRAKLGVKGEVREFIVVKD